MASRAFTPEQETALEQAERLLRAGELVAIPTETVYGLACDATNPSAVEKIFLLKGRPASHPLIAHCADSEHAFRCASQTSDIAQRLAAAFWPGSMALVLPRGKAIPLSVTGGQETVAVRVPNHPLTLELLRRIDRPLAAPSANRFGRVSPTTAAHVRSEFTGTGLFVLDGGPCSVGIESTIVDCCNEASISILRPGIITAHEIVSEIGIDVGCNPNDERPRVSGSLASHYAPQCRVIVLHDSSLQAWVQSHADHTGTTMICSAFEPPVPLPARIQWQPIPRDSHGLARELYGLMRMADDNGVERIVFCLPMLPGDMAEGVDVAVKDRLTRASANK